MKNRTMMFFAPLSLRLQNDDALEAAQAQFLADNPDYEHTTYIDDLRRVDYSRLDDLNHVYLDYTGGGLYGAKQLQTHMQMLAGGVFGNPHSSNPTSMASTELDEAARNFVCEFFNADPDEYLVIFTQNASGALRLVGESYPFEDNGQYLLTFDNHNSVNGIREFARKYNAPITYSPILPPDLRIDADRLHENLRDAIPNGNNLFAFPAQSNFSGVQHDLSWIEEAHELGWDVLLDCAAFAPTNRLDLSVVKPDFVPLSFYKIFGYPTGIGALLLRREMLNKLRRPWFAGGTVELVSVQGDYHTLNLSEAGFEDGTIDYLNLPAVEIGLRHIQDVGVDAIHERVMTLTGWLLDELTVLKHDNGIPLVRIYGPVTTEGRGGTIAMNFVGADGHVIDYQEIEDLANEVNISLRTGCFCNPGANEVSENLTKEEILKCLDGTDRMNFTQYVMALTATDARDTVGALRVSLGIASNFKDVWTFLEFAKSFLNLDAALDS